MIDKGRLRQGDRTLTRQDKCVSGTIMSLCFQPRSLGLEPLIQTPDFALFDKPSGLLVHPAKATDEPSLIDEIKYRYGMEANVIHRLDRETSGLILAAKEKKSERLLKALFVQGSVTKNYLAYAKGHLVSSHIVQTPLHVTSPLRPGGFFAGEGGKSAKTSFIPLRYDPKTDTTLVKAIPHTGRTHQIRLHLADIGHPILGDPLYGTPKEIVNAYLEKRLSPAMRREHTGAGRLMLHAYSLSFTFDARYHVYSKNDFGAPGFLETGML